MTYRLHFKTALDAYAEAREVDGRWVGTINGDDEIRIQADSADGALRAAHAAYIRKQADRIGRGEALGG